MRRYRLTHWIGRLLTCPACENGTDLFTEDECNRCWGYVNLLVAWWRKRWDCHNCHGAGSFPREVLMEWGPCEIAVKCTVCHGTRRRFPLHERGI